MPVTLTWQDDAGAAVSAVFDCDMQETHEGTNIVTEHPVEEGADIADNVRPQLRRFSVEGYVSDTPLLSNPDVVNQMTFKSIELQIPEQPFKFGVSNAINAGIGALGDALFGATPPPRVTMATFDSFKSRKRAARDLLEDARVKARLIRVLTDLAEYSNMVIEQVTITRSPDDGTGATFNVALKEIEKVSSDITVAPEPAELTGAIPIAAGSKHVKDDEAKLAGMKKSLLAQGLDAAQGFFADGFGGI